MCGSSELTMNYITCKAPVLFVLSSGNCLHDEHLASYGYFSNVSLKSLFND